MPLDQLNPGSNFGNRPVPQPPGGALDPNQGQIPLLQFPEFDDTIAKESLALSQEQFEYTKQQEAIKQQNIADALAGVSDLFGKREPTYKALENESKALNMENLYDLENDATQELSFALARSGNTGGSVEGDKNFDLAQKMGLAVGQVEQFAKGQGNQLRAQDSALRASLNSLAATGGVTGSAASSLAGQSLNGLQGVATYAPNLNNSFSGLTSGIGGANTALPQIGSANTPTPVQSVQQTQQQPTFGGF